MKEYLIENVKFTQKDKITAAKYVKFNKMIDSYMQDKSENKGESFAFALSQILRIDIIEVVDMLVETDNKTIIKRKFIEENFTIDDLNEVTEHFFANNDISSTMMTMLKIPSIAEAIKKIEAAKKTKNK